MKAHWTVVLSVLALCGTWAWSAPWPSRLSAAPDLDAPRPIEALDSVWIEQMTWMEVRDALAAGKTTALVTTGGIEDNGPYLATGKHNYIVEDACDAIARALGNALCAPVLKLVPEGGMEPPTGHMRYPGTLSLRESTFEAVLEDVAASLRAHGFERIVFFGDSGGNQAGMRAVAARLDRRWSDAAVHFVPEFYSYPETRAWMNTELGIVEPSNDGLHDDYVVTALLMAHDPVTVRYAQRVAAEHTSINGLSITPAPALVQTGRDLARFRVERTVSAITVLASSGH